MLLALVAPAAAFAQRETSRDALDRVEETLTMRAEDGTLALRDLSPVIVVSVNHAWEETRTWYPAAALATLAKVFGVDALRSCEACMAPRLYVEEHRMEQVSTALGTPEIIRLDENSRGTAPPARTAVWLDETTDGVSLRMIDLRNSRILVAENFDPSLNEMARTKRNFSLTRELERRARGDSLTHTFLDATVYPGQHLSFDWVDQWGATNANLSGFSVSMFDPVIGIGGSYYRVMPKAFNIMVGAKILMSVPTAFVEAISDGQSGGLIDPMLTGVFIVRVPIYTTNYAVTLSASTNGRIGVGITLMNISLLPVLP